MANEQTDLELAKKLRDSGVLVEIQQELLPLNNGIIVVGCADGDQFCDRFDYLRQMLQDAGAQVRPHFITRHGGALRLVKDSPLNARGRQTDLDLLDEIEEAMSLKKIYTILLETHCKCGKCAHHGIDVETALALLTHAKERVLSSFNNVTVATICHVDWAPNRKRYYKFCQSAWLRHSGSVNRPQDTPKRVAPVRRGRYFFVPDAV